MKVKTSELTGNALCYSVCMIEMPELVWGKTIGIHHASPQIVVPELPAPDCYSPFTNWKMLGPIIEREKISLEIKHDGWWLASFQYNYSDEKEHLQLGETPLVAVMRCYVASKLGGEVEIPEELK